MKKVSKNISIGLKLVNQIQKIRSKNNKNWMDLLRLSLKLDFKTTSKILKKICKDDQRISKLAKKILGFKPKYKLADGIKEIVKLAKEKKIKNLFNRNYINILNYSKF